MTRSGPGISLLARMSLLVGMLVAGLTACGGPKAPAPPSELPDPCALISEDLLARLAPGSKPELSSHLGEFSGTRTCAVDLTSGTGGLRGDIGFTIAMDGTESYDEAWRAKQCARGGVQPTRDGPGDHSCFAVRPYQDGEARIDGWAWVGADFEVYVAYQLIRPETFPPGAEEDFRDLLAAGVAALPTG
ncbi:hypothetical protein O7626_20430 [Micromonospora sp. WMMD1102]|uniref:hypothetical protein n=1 Tax=Micromonospora sp. WMMD1102 TaxID=3016105 RepID=UPI0024154BDB|nr:hypothetical protein [Micromonospora sp. WMMD1102]MDG4788276.1 hypothetical protein [Micromonospora sp. WMMD1102]